MSIFFKMICLEMQEQAVLYSSVGSFTYKAPEIMLSLVDEFDPFKAESCSMH